MAGAVPPDPGRPRLRRHARQPGPAARCVRPYADGEELVAMPALDARRRARPHAPRRPGRQRPVPQHRPVLRRPHAAWPRPGGSCRSSRSSRPRTSPRSGPPQSLRISRLMTDGVVETPHGAHFTECVPDYARDEAFQKRVRREREERRGVAEFRATYIDVTEAEYQAAVIGVTRPSTRGAARRPAPRCAWSRWPSASAATARSSPTRSAHADDRRPAGQGDVRARPRDDRRRSAARREHHARRRRRAREGRRGVEPVPHDVRRRVVGPPARR